jgi:hypothetical protein
VIINSRGSTHTYARAGERKDNFTMCQILPFSILTVPKRKSINRKMNGKNVPRQKREEKSMIELHNKGEVEPSCVRQWKFCLLCSKCLLCHKFTDQKRAKNVIG